MELVTDYLEIIRRRRAQKGLPRNEREEMLELFMAKLNAARIKDGFSKLSYGRLAKALQGVPTADLYAFYRQCEQAKSFSRYFWWALKPKGA